MNKRSFLRRVFSGEMAVPVFIALILLIVYSLVHSNYGYFRDELYYIACSHHPALGYVDQPPLSIFVLAASRLVLGESLQAIRFLSGLAIAVTALLAALMARRLGGGRFATGLSSLSVIAAHVLLGQGSYFSMNALDILFWALASLVVIVIIKDDRPKLWPLFGLIVGLGLLNKYSIAFFIIGLVAGLLLTSERKHLFSRWFWLGALIAFLLFLPHLLWEIQHHFPSVEFMRNASQNKNVALSPLAFLAGQLRDINVFNAPVWLLGLLFYFFHREGKHFRPLGWMYVFVFILMVAGHAKVYYLAPVYPVLFAGGALAIEKWAGRPRRGWLKPAVVSLLVVSTVLISPLSIPVLPVESFINYQNFLGMTPQTDERQTLGSLPQFYADQFGWREMVATVAKVYRSLSPQEQAQCIILVRNYGEAGAIDFFGGKYGLPRALCGHNNYWLWGPGEKAGEVAIVFGDSYDLAENLEDLKGSFESVELVARTECTYCMPYENGRQVFLCRGIKVDLKKIWPGEKNFI